MIQNMIYLCYRTDEWLSNDSKELVYVGEEIEDCIAQLVTYKDMTEEQADDIRSMLQSQCNGLGYEWVFETAYTNAFV